MGLCKCPKKKVTNQFCFEHKVNVCEYCMTTSGHQTCIVGPYLQWLDNSSFDSNCYLCKTQLTSSNCVRLCCYHILHLECLNNYANQLPPNTAPAGYICPICTIPIFSFNPKSTNSPVAEILQKSLLNYAWAREGIGLGLMEPAKVEPKVVNSVSNDVASNSLINNGPNSHQSNPNYPSLVSDYSTNINMPSTSSNNGTTFTPKIVQQNTKSYSTGTPISVSTVTSYISTNSDLSFGSTSSMRSKFDNESRRSLLTNVDEIAEDKYRTKSPIEFFSRWLRSRSTYIRNRSSMSSITPYKKFIIGGLLICLILFVLIHLFMKLGRESAENDPFLDPRNDPNLRISNE